MTAIVRNNLRVYNVKTFINSFSSSNSMYLGIGRPMHWDLVQNADVAPAIPENDVSGEHRDWEEMMSLKLVNPADISHGIFREIWAPNTKYDAYRHDWNSNRASVYNGANPFVPTPTNLSDAKYYVITQNYNVYICLKQGTIGGVVQPSTQNPETGVLIGSNTGMYKTSDGYYWKFVCVTTPADAVKFMTDTYHPAKTLTVAPGVNDALYPQWLNQINSAALKRGIYTINVLNGGSGYNGGASGSVSFPSASVTLTGNGSGLSGTVTFGVGGSVQSIEVTNPGTGYTYLTMAITGGTNFTYDVIYTPSWGLGADPVRDLSAYYSIINSSLNSTEGGVFTVTNDYRKICLVVNPTNYNSSTISTAQTLDATTTLTLTSGGGIGAYLPDEIVTDSVTGAKGVVVDWDNVTGKLRIIRTSNENFGSAGASAAFAIGSTVQPATGIISTITPPQVQFGSGDIVYAEYRTPITRSLGQNENITLVLEY